VNESAPLVNFSSAEEVYALHRRAAREYEAARDAPLDPNEYPQLDRIQQERDLHEWEAEFLPPGAVDAAQALLSTAAASANERLVYTIMMKGIRVIGARGRLDIVNLLATEAMKEFGGAWYEEALAE
jgi:hypothetical protein